MGPAGEPRPGGGREGPTHHLRRRGFRGKGRLGQGGLMAQPSTHSAASAPGSSPAPRRGAPRAARQSIWALAGGKGGVGRSLLAANLGIQLARAGRRVVLVDLDLQGSNLPTFLGYQRLPRALADLASGKVALLSELACETPTRHLPIIA